MEPGSRVLAKDEQFFLRCEPKTSLHLAPHVQTLPRSRQRGVQTWAARAAPISPLPLLVPDLLSHRPTDLLMDGQSGQGARAGCVDAIQSSHVNRLRPLRKATQRWWLVFHHSSCRCAWGGTYKARSCSSPEFLEPLLVCAEPDPGAEGSITGSWCHVRPAVETHRGESLLW